MNGRIRMIVALGMVLTALVVGVAVVGVLKFQDGRRLKEAMLRQEQENYRIEAAAAFNEPVQATPEEAAEFIRFLARFSDAVKAEDGPALSNLFSPERMADELVRQGMVIGNRQLTSRDRNDFAKGFRQGARNAPFSPLLQWDTTRIRRIQWSADRNEAVVIASHHQPLKLFGEEVPTTMKMRWWLVRHGSEWRLYDLEDLDGGMRLTTAMAAVTASGSGTGLPQLKLAVAAIRDAQVAMVAADVVALDASLARVRGVNLPAPIAAVVELMDGLSHLFKGDHEATLKALERAEKLNPDMPIRHSLRATCLNQLGNHEGALAAAEAYIVLLGPDADIDTERGTALEALNRLPEAASAFRRALDDEPNEKEAFDGLRRVLPKTDKAELGDRLAKAANPEQFYNQVAGPARMAKDDAAIEIYEERLRKLQPDNPRWIGAHIDRLVEQKKFDEAATEMQTQVKKASEEDAKRGILNSFLFAMIGANRSAEAYAATPDEHVPAAFRLLADELEEMLDIEDVEKRAKTVTQLRELIAANRKRMPMDPWSGFYEASLLQADEEYEKAERAFAEAQALYLKSAKPKAKEQEKDWEADRFRYRRVECLLALDDGPRAYEKVGPVSETFAQLAHAYEGRADYDTLQELVEVHRSNYPNDRAGAFWEAQLLFLREKYAAAADGFMKFLDKADKDDFNIWSATSQCIRGYIRANRARDARAAMTKFGKDRVGTGLRIAVALAENRVVEAEAIMAEQAKTSPDLSFFYYDEDFARLIARPEFAELRKKYPDTRPKEPVEPQG